MAEKSRPVQNFAWVCIDQSNSERRESLIAGYMMSAASSNFSVM